jgi:hypothetical protein
MRERARPSSRCGAAGPNAPVRGWPGARAAPALASTLLAACIAAGCASGAGDSPGGGASAQGGGPGGGTRVACRQKAKADGDDDCAHAGPGFTRKLDCDDDQTEEALEAGCVRESPTSSDVCCPTSVAGVPVAGSGGGGSGGGGEPSDPDPDPSRARKVTCREGRTRNPLSTAVGSLVCSCTGDVDEGVATYDGEVCGQGDPELFCCSDVGYPSSGRCDCFLSRPWRCLQLGTTAGGNVTKCSCAFEVQKVNLPTVATCNLSSPFVRVCCRDPELPTNCECRNEAACSPGEIRVNDCSTPRSAGVLPAPTTCPAGKQIDSSCSVGLSKTKPPPGSSGCDPTSCRGSMCASAGGSSYCCTWSCSGGSCQQSCTD